MAALAFLTLLHVTLISTTVLQLGSTMCTSFLGQPVSSSAFNEAALGKDPPERIALQIFEQIRKVDRRVLAFCLVSGFALGLLSTLLCIFGCRRCLLALCARCTLLRCVVLSGLTLALCLAGVFSLSDGCLSGGGNCRLLAGVQKLWTQGHRTLMLLLLSFGLGAFGATASSCADQGAKPYLPVAETQVESEAREAASGKLCTCQPRLCKVRMGVFTCLVLSVAATLAFSLYRAYRGTCQLAADLQDLRIIYITRAQPRKYGTRLQGQLDTWMNDIPREDLFVTSFTLVADKELAKRDMESVHEFRCPDNHDMGVCCVEANALIQMQNRTFDWVFIVDDDVYVVVDNLRRVLARLHPRSELQTAALGYGITGCVTKGRPCGFCGGGGYALSAKAVQVLLGDDTEKFMHRYMNDCQRTRYCDVTTECLAEQNGTKVFKMHGLHPWRVGNPKWNLTALEGFFHTPSGTLEECPISFHYVQESQTMRAAHELAKRWVPPFGMATSRAADGNWFWADIENRYFVTFGGQPPELGVRRAGPEAPGDPDGDPAAPESRAPECSLGMSSAKPLPRKYLQNMLKHISFRFLCVIGVMATVGRASSESWREAVRSATDADKCDATSRKLIEVSIDSEMLQKRGDHMSLIALAADLQQHRRLPGLPKGLPDLLDKKAKGIGRLAEATRKAQMTEMLTRALFK
eukprot:s2349_g2.t2